MTQGQRPDGRNTLGTGVAFPIGMDVRRQFAMVTGERAVAQAMLTLLLTAPGQRVMRPEYGCRIHDLIFAPGDATTLGLAAFHVDDALRRWEPRVVVQRVDAQVDPANQERMLIDIRYRLVGQPDGRSLVFPFYRTP